MQKNGARVVVEYSKGYDLFNYRHQKCTWKKYIVMGDADGSYDFSNLNFIEKFNENYDVVCGNRFKGGIEKMPCHSFSIFRNLY